MKTETLRNKYEFEKDNHSITLYRIKKNTDKKSEHYGKEVRAEMGHYGSVNDLLPKLVMLELIDKGTIQELFEDLQVVIPKVKELIKGNK